MSTFTRPLAIVLLVLTAGCLPSLNGIYTEADLVFEPKILGFWKQEKSSETWNFSRRDDTSYELVYTDQAGRSGRFIAHLCRIGGTLFLDLFPEKDDVNAAAFYKYHLLPIHTIYQVKQTSQSLELVSLDLKWLNEYLNENPKALSHSTMNDQKLITASTPELQKFLLDHKDKFTGSFRLIPPPVGATVGTPQ
ncbi:MAG: hypothetical protein HQ518_01160 [Rhodopirellula sp.]|nr:hypothetical protein [Rhodopirellula sp.]